MTFNKYKGLQIALFSSVKKHPFLLKYIEEIINMNIHKQAPT